ncbi:hypothetical protein ABZT28_51740 [Streptomyces sp. NPDC005388]|uniref:hypothetical protein n=1 Tax=Streptomyces sp. NPDC005388 TaxID=3156717 RepID=UPI0033B2DA69
MILPSVSSGSPCISRSNASVSAQSMSVSTLPLAVSPDAHNHRVALVHSAAVSTSGT